MTTNTTGAKTLSGSNEVLETQALSVQDSAGTDCGVIRFPFPLPF